MRSPLATRELGRTSGPVLVLLHANGDSAASWPDAARRWGDRYRVVAVDARGHGASPWFSPGQLEEPGDVFIADAIELLEDATLVVTGERDCLVGEATRAELDAIANPAIEVVVVPEAGHYVRQDQTDAFHAVVDPWLAERLRRGGGA